MQSLLPLLMALHLPTNNIDIFVCGSSGPNTTEPIVTDTNSDSKFGYGTVVMTLSPDATRLAATSSDGHEIYPIRIWNTNTGGTVVHLGRTYTMDSDIGIFTR